MRRNFFKDQLVQLLWIRFRTECHQEVHEYLQGLKETELERYTALVKDMQDLSDYVGF